MGIRGLIASIAGSAGVAGMTGAAGDASICGCGNPEQYACRLIGQVVLVFGLSFVATKPKGGGWTRCDLSSWLARSCWFYPGF